MFIWSSVQSVENFRYKLIYFTLGLTSAMMGPGAGNISTCLLLISMLTPHSDIPAAMWQLNLVADTCPITVMNELLWLMASLTDMMQ